MLLNSSSPFFKEINSVCVKRELFTWIYWRIYLRRFQRSSKDVTWFIKL